MLEVAEEKRDSNTMGPTSASAAAVITSCPKRLLSSPTSFNTGKSRPADVDT